MEQTENEPEEAGNGRNKLKMGQRLRMDGAGYRWAEEAGNRWSRLPREGRLWNEIHRRLLGSSRWK